MKRFLSVLVGLFLSLTSVAQVITPIDWTGNHLNPYEQTVLLDSTWSGLASVKAYTEPGGRLISSLLQPVVTRTGNALFIRFAATANMSNRTYVTITTGTIVRRAGYLNLGYVSGVTAPGGIDAGGVNLGIINTDMVQGLNLILAKKVDVQSQTARDAGQDKQIQDNAAAFASDRDLLNTALGKKMEAVFSTSAGATTAAQIGPAKLIIEVLAGSMTVYIYAPTASPALQKILTYN